MLTPAPCPSLAPAATLPLWVRQFWSPQGLSFPQPVTGFPSPSRRMSCPRVEGPLCGCPSARWTPSGPRLLAAGGDAAVQGAGRGLRWLECPRAGTACSWAVWAATARTQRAQSRSLGLGTSRRPVKRTETRKFFFPGLRYKKNPVSLMFRNV